MKKTALFLMMVGLLGFGRAEQHISLSEELSGETNHYYSATDHIMLLPGFKAEPKSNHAVKIHINPYDATPPTTGMYGGPESNDDGVVGSVKGSIDIGSLGAATYSIPIKMPEGLGGMVPSLFVYYNNQHRNGLLGWNWDLGGLSAITRTGNTIYHDGYHNEINYTTDRFCLDGQRLLKVSSGNYGADGTVYHTEVDQMSKIVSYTSSVIRGPSYFKVWTADGKICYYGNSQDSKALINADGYVTTWLLKSIQDRYGNVIRYHYQNDANAYYLSKIEYSGNKNLDIETSFSIVFHYKSRDDIEYTAQGSMIQAKELLLDNIIVYNQTSPMYTYSFEYQPPDPQSGYPYHLLTSIGFNTADQHVNPTRILWGDNNYGIPSVNSTSVPVTTHSITSAFANAIKFSGDFNGDGFTDVIAVRPDLNGDYHDHAYVFLNKGRSGDLTFDLVKTFDLEPQIHWIYVGDFDGNGYDDILFTNRTPYIPSYLDQITATAYLTQETPAGDLVFESYQLPQVFISSTFLESLVIGDFYGEGRQSILIQTMNMEVKTHEESILFRFDDTSFNFQASHFNEYLHTTHFYPGDYDGDGAIELLFNWEGYTSIVKLVQTNDLPHFVMQYQGTPYNWNDCFPGDFNGDGVTDVLFYTSSASQKWFIKLFTQTGLPDASYYLSSSFPYQTLEDYHYTLSNPHETDYFITIGDFDGNGCADLILKEDANNVHVYYGPIHPGGECAPFANHRQINTQRFSYFSNTDLCVGNFLGEDRTTFLGNYTLSHLPSMNLSHEVKKITDGLGQVTKLEYDYLMPNPKNPSESDFYYLQSISTSYINKIDYSSIPLRALKKVTTYNVKNQPVSTECHYEGALFHKQGKGFLGFSKTRQKDYCDNQLQKTTVRLFETQPYDPVVHMQMTEEEVFDQNDGLMAKTEYANYFYLNKNNPKVFVPISNKYSYEYDVDHPDRLIKKEINEQTVETHSDEPYEYDNFLSVVQTINGTTENPSTLLASSCPFQTKTIVTYMPDDINQWLINRPKKVTRIDHREGNYGDICHQLVYAYSEAKPYQLKSITAIPNDGSNPNHRLTKKTDFQYDDLGNLTSKTVSAPYDDVQPRTESYTFSSEYGYRLMTEYTNPAGQTSFYRYDPVYNYCISTIDCNLMETLYETDPLGITTKALHPDGTISYKAIRWDNKQYYQWEKKTGLPTKITYYAITGDPIKKASYSLNGEVIESSIEYDPMGRVQKEQIPHGEGQLAQVVTYSYDEHNRVKNIIHQDGTRENITYDGRTTCSTFYSNNKEPQTESKTVNIMGWVVKSTDANGTSVIYDYYSDGKLKQTQIEGMDETFITVGYDANGNRSLFYDPNYGLSSYEYNIFGEMTRQVTPKNDFTDYEYDALGNITKRIEHNYDSTYYNTTEWLYGTEVGRHGLLEKIISENQTVEYQYDNKLRLKTIKDRVLGEEYVTTYQYDQASRVSDLTYPSGYSIHYCYSSEGFVRSITDEEAHELWRGANSNALGLPTRIITGDGIVTEFNYDEISNKLTKIKMTRGNETLQEYQYEYDDFSNITARINVKKNNSEHFSYDPLNRLTTVVDNKGESNFYYDALGRMTGKTDHGENVFSNAIYGEIRPHAIKSAITSPGVFPQDRMDLEYTSFGKVSHIQEGQNQISYQYGYDHQRIHVTENIGGTVREKTYVNNFESIIQPNGTLVKRTFLSGPSGIFAVVETDGNKTSLHYIHKDHLGSWTLITDSDGQIEQENWFDAWGNSENSEELLFDRGYTGHEHIKGMNLVNMDGRLYDPVTSSMLSPDNYVQEPDFTQNFNRYAYCLNNPLSYSDPDGNNPILVAAMIYFIFFTDMGYELQKYVSPIAIHINLHLAGHQKGVGLDVSIGFEKQCMLSYRMHLGATYYWGYYDDSYQGWEFRVGGEWTVNGVVGFSGTTFYTKGQKQTTNTIILGNFMGSVSYENDYMFNIANYLFGIPPADNGDRYRSAAGKIRLFFVSAGFNIFTGDPGLKGSSRKTFADPDAGGRLTYTLNEEGNDPDQYRAGIIYFRIGTFCWARNSEQIRHYIQNRFAHDILCQGDSPYFKVLDRPTQSYFYFSSGTGNTLW